MSIELRIAVNIHRVQNDRMFGPTHKQAVKMAKRRADLLADARTADAAGDDERAFDLDAAAWDIERDLQTYGFNITTGRPTRRRA